MVCDAQVHRWCVMHRCTDALVHSVVGFSCCNHGVWVNDLFAFSWPEQGMERYRKDSAVTAPFCDIQIEEVWWKESWLSGFLSGGIPSQEVKTSEEGPLGWKNTHGVLHNHFALQGPLLLVLPQERESMLATCPLPPPSQWLLVVVVVLVLQQSKANGHDRSHTGCGAKML